MNHKVNIVVPVYADWKTLSKCISSLKKYYADVGRVDIYFINDCGPDADRLERNIKKSIRSARNFYYKSNDKNMGFVQNCNNAVFDLVRDKSADILLLNSDTVVTEGFLEEMQRIMYSQGDIGIVNPRSNNATVWSVPMDGRYEGSPRRAYKQWKRLKLQIPEKYISPTAHGFCMLIRRGIIDKIGLFDEVYGIGYGEENDFTMRALAHGWSCASANYAFVVHYGSRSFGDKNRIIQSERNSKILLDRYPNYNNLIQEYVATTKETYSVHNNMILLKTAHATAKAVEYGHYNGYLAMTKKGLNVLKTRYKRTDASNSEPKIHIWSHQISFTGAPLVLFDILRQWKIRGIPSSTVFHVPNGGYVDNELLSGLVEEGFDFKETNPVSLRFNAGDIVVLNSSAYPEWVYDKILSQLAVGNIKHLFIYIHEDDDKMIGALGKFSNELKKQVLAGIATIYVPSSSSAVNWQKFFGIKKGIRTMSGHISYSSGMFVPKSPDKFEKIDFIIAGSSEPHKGQLSVEYAFISFYNQYYKHNKTKYRNFSLTIAGIKKDTGGYYAEYIINAASSLNDKVKLIHYPNLKQMHEAMADCNFTITYSIKDSFSIVTMEGMAFGHPIIRSESSGRHEQLSSDNGWAVDTKEWEKLVDTIEVVLNKDKTTNKELAKMSIKSVEIAKKNHDAKYRIINDITKAAIS